MDKKALEVGRVYFDDLTDDQLEEIYLGYNPNRADFAREYFYDLYDLDSVNEVPQFLINCIDWADVAREMETGGAWFEHDGYWFNANWY